MIIRDYSTSDQDRLSEIYLLSRKFAFPWLDSESFQKSDFIRDTKGERIWVCELDSLVVGFVSVWEPDNFVHHLFVHPDYIRNGYGKRLLGKAISGLFLPVTLKCQKRNTSALAFYKSLGWKEAGTGLAEEGEYSIMEFS